MKRDLTAVWTWWRLRNLSRAVEFWTSRGALEVRQSGSEAHRLSRPVAKWVPALHGGRWSGGGDLPWRVPSRLRSQESGFGRQPGSRGFAAPTAATFKDALSRDHARRFSPLV